MTYVGALPFIACASMIYTGINNIGPLGPVNEIVSVYALIIISFIAGIHLGTYLFYNTKTPKALFIISNAVAALAWMSLLFANPSNSVLILVGAFIYLLGVDFLLKREMFISTTYFITRIIVTVISAGSLLFVSGMS
ncbi:MAG: DUF3429 domain-containing protein [Gammaproteobacteria bacterium]|nr:DUF3429 domain-containing protein [Gammaproteobacteria bacterium]